MFLIIQRYEDVLTYGILWPRVWGHRGLIRGWRWIWPHRQFWRQIARQFADGYIVEPRKRDLCLELKLVLCLLFHFSTFLSIRSFWVVIFWYLLILETLLKNIMDGGFFLPNSSKIVWAMARALIKCQKSCANDI